jgi:hypothetical protein
MSKTLADRCGVMEECYEFMLAYAAQGLTGDSGGGRAGAIRDFLKRGIEAVSGLAAGYVTAVEEQGLEHPDRYKAFLAVLDRDAQDTLAVMELVLAQPVISSQLIDNLNASIHLRALLTDLFLIDEVFKACAKSS